MEKLVYILQQRCAVSCMLLVFAVLQTEVARAQSSLENLFYEKYTVQEDVYYLLPDSTSHKDMTEWDWIDMEPRHEIRTHEKAISPTWLKTERIDIDSLSPIESWEKPMGHIIIDNLGAQVYSLEGNLISDLPHSEFYLANEDTLMDAIIEDGLSPMLPFPLFEDLPIEELQNGGYEVSYSNQSYTISTSDGSHQIFIDPIENLRVYQNFDNVVDEPYYSLESFVTTTQGYLRLGLSKSKVRRLSRKGKCLVEVRTESYSGYQLFYDEAIITEQEINLEDDFAMFPNPVSSVLEMTYSGTEYENSDINFIILDQYGTEYINTSINPASVMYVDVNALTAGLYIARFIMPDGNQFTKNLIKN
ncbi:hypothetical protein [Owenweeksia hongkongensis]|uniref:hypothetical protein n=2 Tax=Owenweeksia hongkongensis TaxID=253245 RepID=UPI003A92C61B